MCIILKKPAGIILDRDIYKTCFENNDDGAGIAYAKDKKLVVSKGFFKFDEFYDQEIKPNEERELLIHFRVASPNMVINGENCHPFSFSTEDGKFDFALVHNGRLDYDVKPGRSDTSCFTEDVMAPHLGRDPWFLDQALGIWMLNRIINPLTSSKNKIAIMRYDVDEDKTEVFICGERLGVKAHGCWFSNDSYLPPPPKQEWRGHLNYGGEFNQQDWVQQYSYAEVKGKWTPYFEWAKLVKDEREKIQSSNPCIIPGWQNLTLAQQDNVIKFRLGFDNVKINPLDVKQPKPIIPGGVIDHSKIKRHDTKMKWLSKAQRTQLRRCALAYCKQTVGLDLESMTWDQMIDWMRHDFRETEACVRELNVAALDKFILAVDDQDPMFCDSNEETNKKLADADKEYDEAPAQPGTGVDPDFTMHQRGAFD